MTGFELKLFAAVVMLIDHIGAYIFTDQMLLRIIGRLAMPVFVWLVAEGCRHTHSMRSYALRLALAAAVAEPCVDFVRNGSFAMDWSGQSIMLTLLLGVLSVWALQSLGEMAGGAVALICCSMAQVLQCDYKWYGVALLLVFYYCRSLPKAAVSYAVFSVLWQWNMLAGWVTDGRWQMFLTRPHQLWGLLAFIPLAFYNGQRGLRCRWFFYVFYPAHLLLLGLLIR